MPARLDVKINRAFLARVYEGPDYERFAQWLGQAIAHPETCAVAAAAPATLGVVEVMPATFGWDTIAYGHFLKGDWRLVTEGIAWAKEKGAEAFLYPVGLGRPRPNTRQLCDVLKRRYGFRPHHTVYVKAL